MTEKRRKELEKRLRLERIQGRKTWGLYVDLMLEVRATYVADVTDQINELRLKERPTGVVV